MGQYPYSQRKWERKDESKNMLHSKTETYFVGLRLTFEWLVTELRDREKNPISIITRHFSLLVISDDGTFTEELKTRKKLECWMVKNILRFECINGNITLPGVYRVRIWKQPSQDFGPVAARQLPVSKISYGLVSGTRGSGSVGLF